MLVSRVLRSAATTRKGTPISRLESTQFFPEEQRIKAEIVRSRLGGKPLTYAEKILFGHLAHPEMQQLERGSSALHLQPIRVALHDANAQTIMLQFDSIGLDKVQVPTSIHTDHLIQSTNVGGSSDLTTGMQTNREVYDFLQSMSARYGIGYWAPNSGILHTIILEHYAFPGALLAGSDSHTPNAAGLGCLGIGVGGAEAVDIMAGSPWQITSPRITRVNLTGKMSRWASAKDIILEVAGRISVKGGTGHIMEYCGPGATHLSATGMATIGNMGAEIGATSTLFPFNTGMSTYLRKTKRSWLADWADSQAAWLQPDAGAEYDRNIEIDLDALEPRINGPFTPDLRTPLSQMKQFIKHNKYPANLSAALIGSCTNSSFEDLDRATNIAKQAIAAGLKPQVPLYITLGSQTVQKACEDAGHIKTFSDAGATFLSQTCGPCVGQWSRDDIAKGEVNSIVSSFNRNFVGRQDGNAETCSFISSPEVVAAMAFAGRLDFDPATDAIPLPDQQGEFRFAPPHGRSVVDGEHYDMEAGLQLYYPPPVDGSDVEVKVDPSSERLQRLTPWPAWDGQDSLQTTVLIKVNGKCTTDHISPAGPWYRYRGHMQNLSRNLLIGAVNSANGERNCVENVHSAESSYATVPEVADQYRASGIHWSIVGDDNYGEGSSREAAAMTPRYMGGRIVLARSMARIHETNLSKQGLLPLHFVDAADYDLVESGDQLTVSGLRNLSPGKPLEVSIAKRDGSTHSIMAKHNFGEEQIRWFKAGGAINAIRAGYAASRAVSGGKEHQSNDDMTSPSV